MREQIDYEYHYHSENTCATCVQANCAIYPIAEPMLGQYTSICNSSVVVTSICNSSVHGDFNL